MSQLPKIYLNYVNSVPVATLATKIAELEDEFKICRQTGQTERAALIECVLGENYQALMSEVEKQELSTIEVTFDKVKITFKRQDVINQ